MKGLIFYGMWLLRSAAKWTLVVIAAPVYATLALVVSIAARKWGKPKDGRPRLVWGPAPIINNAYWARAMRAGGWNSVSYTDLFAYTINRREDYDLVLQDQYPRLPAWAARPIAFLASLWRYDVFFISFNGWFLGDSVLWRLEAPLLRIADKRTVVIPFGGDAFVFRRTASTSLAHGLIMTVPYLSRRQRMIAQHVDYWVDRADAVIPGMMGPDGIGRSDLLAPSSLCIDLNLWQPTRRRNDADGRNGTVVVAHAPNFRGFKGSEFLIAAVETLRAEGLSIDLRLLEGVQNSEVRRLLGEDADILVEQLVATGHGLNGIEGMASGLPVICNLEDPTYTRPMRRWSFLDECPILSAGPETVVEALRTLVTRPDLRVTLGVAGRAYAEKYHGYDAACFQFSAVVDWVYGKDVNLIDLCNPRNGPYTLRKPPIEHPLVEGRLR